MSGLRYDQAEPGHGATRERVAWVAGAALLGVAEVLAALADRVTNEWQTEG